MEGLEGRQLLGCRRVLQLCIDQSTNAPANLRREYKRRRHANCYDAKDLSQVRACISTVPAFDTWRTAIKIAHQL